MFWKPVERLFFSTGRPRSKWPISFVLTAFYTFSTSAILFFATGFLYWMTQRSMEQEADHSLADQIEVVRSIFREKPNDSEAIQSEIQSEGAARRFAKYYARILDNRGNVLMETTEMKGLPLSVEIFPLPIPLAKSPEQGIRWRSPQGNWYLLMAAWAEEGTADKTPRVLQVALDITQDAVILTRYRRMLFVVLVVGLICSAAIGLVIARRGMRPLAEITEAARTTTAARLHERLTPARWPKELADLAKAFDEMLDRLGDSFNRLSQFSADLAHELRTPINNLRGEAEVALSRSRTSEEYRHTLESSLEEFSRLASMIDNLLFLARAENNQTAIQRAPLDARAELEAVRQYYEAVAAEQEVEVTCHGEAIINADPILFRRAVSNLLSNALHYTPRHGKITITARPLDDHSFTVIVSDTGSGIAPEHLPKIFDRFYRADPSRARHPDGSGLGLAIVRSIMQLHGGTVAIECPSGKGTTVTLKFVSPNGPIATR